MKKTTKLLSGIRRWDGGEVLGIVAKDSEKKKRRLLSRITTQDKDTRSVRMLG